MHVLVKKHSLVLEREFLIEDASRTHTHAGCDFHGAKTLTRADTLFFSKELFHTITKIVVQEKQLFLT